MSKLTPRLVKGSLLAVVAAAGVFSLLASGGGGQTGDGTGPGNLHMTIKRLAGPNMLCPPTNVSWRLEPGTITGSNGINAGMQKPGAYAGGNTTGQPPFECNYADTTLFNGLRPGTWTLTATTGTATASCTKTVSGGPTTQSFWTFDTAGNVQSCQ
jgi:hypothetical protein